MLHRLTTVVAVVSIAIGTFLSQSASAQVATTSAEYRTPGLTIDSVSPNPIDVWARVYRPQTLTSGQRYPLIVMLHGQHGTCGRTNPIAGGPRIDNDDVAMQYAFDGTCPAGYTVVKSHEGYAYLANDLASRGYIVASINANRGFTSQFPSPGDSGKVQMRGRLVLWHLLKFYQWNNGIEATPASLGVSFQNRIDFSQVGLMGHSRGALGMRAALANYRIPSGLWAAIIPNMKIRALLEMAPPDEDSTEPITKAWGLPHLYLVGTCDGENPSFFSNPVPGKHFNRLLLGGGEGGTHFKASYGIEGANHRYFNTQWQQNDVLGCPNQASYLTFTATEVGSQTQRDRALVAVRSFFLATVGTRNDPSLARMFNPTYAAPSGHRVIRAFSASPTYLNSLRLEEFTGPTGINSNSVANNTSQLTDYFHMAGDSHPQDGSYPFARMAWSGGASTNKYFQTNWSTSNGWNLSAYQYLEFRVDNLSSEVGGAAPEFNIQLVDKDNLRSALVSNTSYATLSPQPGSRKDAGGDGIITFPHRMMRTIRIPMSAFTGVNLANIRGARFVFNRTASGSIALASIVGAIDSNLARGRAVTTSTNESATLSGANAVDGNTGTRWSSAHVENQWIRVDLGWSQTFKTVILRWEAAYGRNYTIQVSDNGTSWTTVHTVTNASAGTHILNLASMATGRYVRMNGTLRGTNFGYSLFEFEVYPN